MRIDTHRSINTTEVFEMSEQCTPVDCESCGIDCSSRMAGENPDFSAHLSKGSSVKHVYAVMSGKGGVGKSLVTTMLACAFAKAGHRTAILDADITGPSIPKAFNVDRDGLKVTDDQLMVPVESKNGIRIISANLLLDNESDPIIWRGALIASAVKQFYEETLWEDIDYMFVDMPPGTGDVPLTVFQSLPVEGIIMVTSPQDLVSMIVGKAVNMAKMMAKPVIGVVEKMSYYECPDCGKKHSIFGDSHIDDVAQKFGLSVLAKLPIDTKTAELIDQGRADEIDTTPMDKAVDVITTIAKFGSK